MFTRSIVSALGAVLIFSLGACDKESKKVSEKYPEDFRESFVRHCTEASKNDEAYCKCVIGKLEETTPYEKLKEYEDKVREGKEGDIAIKADIEKAAAACH